MVPGGGIEPPQAFWALRILSPLRLPISPSRLAAYFSLGMRRRRVGANQIALSLGCVGVLGNWSGALLAQGFVKFLGRKCLSVKQLQ